MNSPRSRTLVHSLCLFGLVFLHPAAAQDTGSAETQIPKFVAHSNLVFLPTRVQDKNGKTIYGLTADQFIVEDNGVRQAVQVDEEPGSSGLSLVVLVQCSRSAPEEFRKIKGLGAMVDAIAGAVPHEVAVVSYGYAPYVLRDFTTSSDAVRSALARIEECGEFHAETIDAVYYAINLLRRHGHSHYRRAILLISEMRDHGSRSKLQEVVAELGITDTAIYSVAFAPVRNEMVDGLLHGDDSDSDSKSPPPKPPPPLDSAEAGESAPPVTEPIYTDRVPRMLWPPQFLVLVNALRRNAAEGLASLSGGEYFTFTTQKNFERSLEQIANSIHNYYLLRYQPPESPILVLHTLRVRVEGYPHAIIQTRKNYWSGIYESSGSDPH